MTKYDFQPLSSETVYDDVYSNDMQTFFRYNRQVGGFREVYWNPTFECFTPKLHSDENI